MKFTFILFLFLSVQLKAQDTNWSQGTGYGMGMFAEKPPEPLDVTSHTTITVKLNSKKSVSCELDSLSKIYVCPNNGDPVLVKQTPFGFSALGRNKKKSPAGLLVLSVESQGKKVFERSNGGFGGGYMGNESEEDQSEDLSRESIKINIIDEFLTNPTFLNGKFEKERIKMSPENYNIAQGFIEQRRAIEDVIQKAYNEKAYDVELEDGQKIKCERGGMKELTAQMKAIQQNLGQTIKCGSFKCSPVVVDGKSYDSTMIFDSNQAAMISGSVHLTDKDGIGPAIKIKKVFSPSSNIPLVDHSRMISENMTYMDMTRSSAMLFPKSIKNEDRVKLATYKDPTFDLILQWYRNVCADESELDKLSEARKKLLEKLASADLAEFIQVLSNGSLVGSFVDPSIAPELGCLYQGVYLNEEAAKNLSRLKKNIFPDKVVEQTITPDRAKALFKKAQDMKDIAWKYKPDGCYARAHLMARRFEEEGVRVDKVWIKGDLFVEGTPIHWNFHVAPIVYVQNESGKVEKMVIDPSLFDKPVTVEEWDKKMSKKTVRGSVITAFPFPENAAFMERSSLSFSSSDPYLPTESIDMTEESKMNQANATMKMYKSVEPK